MGGTKIDSESAAPRGKATLKGRKGTATLLITAAGYLECRLTLDLAAAQQRLVCSLYKQANCICEAR
jgi:hypothetical protein